MTDVGPNSNAGVASRQRPGRHARAHGQSAHAPTRGGPGRQRLNRLYLAVAGGCTLLLLVIIFVAQNYRTVPIHVLGWRYNLALGLSMLLSALVGGLIVLLITGARILQLRRREDEPGRANRRSGTNQTTATMT